MNTYRVYVLDTRKALFPAVTIAYIQAAKYGPAWQAARALLADGKPHKEHSNVKQMFSDAECKAPLAPTFGDDLTVAKIVDIKPRNVKVDKAKLGEIINDTKMSAEDKLKALQLQLAGGAPAPAPAVETK